MIDWRWIYKSKVLNTIKNLDILIVSYKDSISEEGVVQVVFTFRYVSIIAIIDLIAVVSLVKASLFED